jgi:hypothetical protein
MRVVKEFAAETTFPVSNSLMYSIYKMLPNDTDLTVLENKSIQGYNFAFIDTITTTNTPKMTSII